MDMLQTSLDQIRAIAQAFDDTLQTGKGPGDAPWDWPGRPSMSSLRDRIYNDFFCKLPSTPAQAGAAWPELLAPLRAAFKASRRFEPGWRVVAIDGADAVRVSKNGRLRHVAPAQIEIEPAQHNVEPAQQDIESTQQDVASTQLGIASAPPGTAPARGGLPRPGATVGVSAVRAAVDLRNGFYYLQTPEAADPMTPGTPAKLRFYWNVRADGATALLSAVVNTMQAHAIPFEFKCPLRAPDYARVDSAVLYVARGDYPRAAAAVAELYPAVAAHLDGATPLFTWPWAPGLAFAEDPGPRESFGIQRCRLVAEGLYHAYRRGQSATAQRIRAVRRQFARHHISLAQPYLRPWSLHQYPLPAAFQTAGDTP